jgi:hypothetical protein
VRSGDESDSKLTFLGRAFPLPHRRYVLLLGGALFGELPDHLFSEPRSLREHVVEAIKYLF